MAGPTYLGTRYGIPIYHEPPTRIYYNPEYERGNLITSYNHRRRNGKYVEGGPFHLIKESVTRSKSGGGPIHWGLFSGEVNYEGSLLAVDPPDIVKADLDPDLDLSQFGPELYNAARPDKPYMRLGNSIYELKDVPGMLKQRFTADLRGAGNYWLALQFGWKPLLDDVRKLVLFQRYAYKRVQQLLRDNGRPVHRRLDSRSLSYENVSDHMEDTYGAFTQVFVTQNYKSVPRYTTRYISGRKIWFEGEFVFYIDDVKNSSLSKDQITRLVMRRVFGLYPSPLNVYKAIPWTWLIDWFTNVGDNIANMNADAADRLINNYAYVMCHQYARSIGTAHGTFRGFNDSTVSHTSTVRKTYDIKGRSEASPFGFRIKREELSPFQLGILTALGTTRGFR
jgi:hypothetical protein